MCRTVFFPAHFEDYEDEEEDQDEDDVDGYSDEDDEDIDEEGNDDEDCEQDDGPEDVEDRIDGREQTLLAAFQRLESSSISTPTGEEMQGQDCQEWFQRWPLPTSQQIEDSQKRARQVLLRSLPSGLMQRSPLQIYSSPADLESRATMLASAYRTMAFRETLLYLNLREAGARIPLLEFPHRGLPAQHEEALLWELGQRGAFCVTHLRPGHMALTNRESWFVHRAKGEVYTYEISPAGGRGFWITGLSSELDEE